MTIRYPTFLPGVPEDLVRTALAKAAGNEIGSGKLDSPESSAALVVNSFGWSLERPAELPPFPPLAKLDWPAARIEVERKMRFPWCGGRHPRFDAAVETATNLIGVEFKRFEPFRDAKKINLSDAYDREVWGENMAPFTEMRDRLRAGHVCFEHLDATQLVKHAFGLVTEGRRLGKAPMLLYFFAKPKHRGASTIPTAALERYLIETNDFVVAVADAEVRFVACSWRDWLTGWSGDTRNHADALITCFHP